MIWSEVPDKLAIGNEFQIVNRCASNLEPSGYLGGGGAGRLFNK